MADPGARASRAMVLEWSLRERHLVDASAWSKARDEVLAVVFDDAVRGGWIVTCSEDAGR